MDKKKRVGTFIAKSTEEETYRCYVPQKLPPDPPLQIEQFYYALDKANVALGELNGIRAHLPNADLFFYTFRKKEAILSFHIEGTQSSL